MAFFHVIIPAAGIGSRMTGLINKTPDSHSTFNGQAENNVIPKQYLPLNGLPVISHSIQLFDENPRISQIHVALSSGDIWWHSLNLKSINKLNVYYSGGETRSRTVLQTLQSLEKKYLIADDDWILVHDAARPGLTQQLLDDLLDAVANDVVGGLLALPVSDTLKRGGLDDKVEKTISRENLWQAQTPQMFRYLILKRALESADQAFTDEAEAVETLGLKPRLVIGSLRNLKITYPDDLNFLEAIFKTENSGN